MVNTKNEKSQSAWQRRKEYSEKFRLSASSVKRKIQLSPSKSNSPEILSRKPVITKSAPLSGVKPSVLSSKNAMPKFQEKMRSTTNKNSESSKILSKRKATTLPASGKFVRSPKTARNVTVVSSKPKLSILPRKIEKKASVQRSPLRKPSTVLNRRKAAAFSVNRKIVPSPKPTKTLAVISSKKLPYPSRKTEFQNKTTATLPPPPTKRPKTNFGNNLANIQAPPAKRVRRNSFTISNGKENNKRGKNIAKPEIRPIISKPVPKRPEVTKRQAVQFTDKTSKNDNPSVVKRQLTPFVPRETKNHPHSSSAGHFFNEINKENITSSVKKTAQSDGTPLVRLPIRERLALWRDRRETLEAENAKRRKTVTGTSLKDILNASRHEGCFVTKDATYSCPYGKKKRVINRQKIVKKAASSVVEQEHVLHEEKEKMPLEDVDNSHEEMQETLMELQSLLINGSSVTEVHEKLLEMKKRMPDIENNAHYWKVMALIAERNGNTSEAMEIYETAAENGAEPVEVIIEAVQTFIERLEEAAEVAPKVSTAKRSKTTEKDIDRSKKKKRLTVSPKNMFESTLIEYAIQNYTSLVTKLSEFLNVDCPPVEGYAIPVRRSARLSKSKKRVAKRDEDVRKNLKLLFKTNKSLLFDE